MAHRYELTPSLVEEIRKRANDNAGKVIEGGLIKDVENLIENVLELRPELRLPEPDKTYKVTYSWSNIVQAKDRNEAEGRSDGLGRRSQILVTTEEVGGVV